MVSEGFSGNYSSSDPSRDSWYRAVSTPMEKERKWSEFAKNPIQNDTVSEFQLLFILEVADRWGHIGEGFEVFYHCFQNGLGAACHCPCCPQPSWSHRSGRGVSRKASHSCRKNESKRVPGTEPKVVHSARGQE
jgi:hypothetical protein